MIGFVPRPYGEDDRLALEPSVDPPTYVHPSAAIAYAQRIAASDGAAVLVLVPVDSDEWSPCCPDCLVSVGGRHDCTQRTSPRGHGDVVGVFEAVYRPATTVRAAP